VHSCLQEEGKEEGSESSHATLDQEASHKAVDQDMAHCNKTQHIAPCSLPQQVAVMQGAGAQDAKLVRALAPSNQTQVLARDSEQEGACIDDFAASPSVHRANSTYRSYFNNTSHSNRGTSSDARLLPCARCQQPRTSGCGLCSECSVAAVSTRIANVMRASFTCAAAKDARRGRGGMTRHSATVTRSNSYGREVRVTPSRRANQNVFAALQHQDSGIPPPQRMERECM
jgi:hypothetical protein